jgi:muconolactone delta-isomerase
MNLLAIEKEVPNVDAEAFEPHLKAEAYKVWELYQAGIIREAYFRQDRSEVVLMLECDDVEEAHEILQSLPLVYEGLIAFDVIPLVPYSGFSRLFYAQQKLVVTGNSKVRVTLFL